MLVKKAGCILIKEDTKEIGVIYRTQRDDYSFPKGHLELGESLIECAMRETMEETKRLCKIVEGTTIVQYYHSSTDEECECHFYLALDKGPSTEGGESDHKLVWVALDKVEDKLSYNSLKEIYKQIKPKIEEILKN